MGSRGWGRWCPEAIIFTEPREGGSVSVSASCHLCSTAGWAASALLPPLGDQAVHPQQPNSFLHTCHQEPGRPWPNRPSCLTLLREGLAHALARGWQPPLPYRLPRMNLTLDGDQALPVNAGPSTGGAWERDGDCGQAGLCRPVPTVTDLSPFSILNSQPRL